MVRALVAAALAASACGGSSTSLPSDAGGEHLDAAEDSNDAHDAGDTADADADATVSTPSDGGEAGLDSAISPNDSGDASGASLDAPNDAALDALGDAAPDVWNDASDGAVALPTGSCVGTSLLADCSFETPVVPAGACVQYPLGSSVGAWTVVGQAGNVNPCSTLLINGLTFPPEDGAQAMDLTGTSNSFTGVQQVVATTPGSAYLLAFWVGNQYDTSGTFGTTSTVEVFVDGTQVMAAVNDKIGLATLAWEEFGFTFTATAATTTIAFVNADPTSDTSNVAGEDATDAATAVVLEDGAVCFKEADAATVVVSVGSGSGAFALQIWGD
jgi:hypothetical protein